MSYFPKPDITFLYYTANRIHEAFADAIRNEFITTLEKIYGHASGLMPIISVSHKPIAFGHNVCVGVRESSIYNVYMQILIGARLATTPYVAMVEDDSVYCPEHFRHRPALDTFAYNRNRWVITRRLSADKTHREAFFYWRERTQMAQCVCPRELLVATLEERFAKYPRHVPNDVAYKSGWGEPGRYEKNLGITRQQRVYFETTDPNVTFNHSVSIRGRRQVKDTDVQQTNIPYWGDAGALWTAMYGKEQEPA